MARTCWQTVAHIQAPTKKKCCDTTMRQPLLLSAIVLIASCAISTRAAGQIDAQLAPFGMMPGTGLHPQWQFRGLPGKTIAPTAFEWTVMGGVPALEVRTERSYGLLRHAWKGAAPAELAWRWQVAQTLPKADIAVKSGDDAALKVCVMFDQPIAEIPLLQRASLSLAGAATGEAMPHATLCYLWDNRYPSGTTGVNPYTARVRYMVLNGTESAAGVWLSQRRRLADDFAQLFGSESPHTPPVTAVVVGADSDNTQGSSLAYIDQLRWLSNR